MTERARRRGKKLEWQLVVNSYPCVKCGVPPGRSCRSDLGHVKTEPHADRSASAAARGWAFADAPARCVKCHGKLPGENPDPGRCPRCVLREDGPLPTHATRDHPGPDGSWDVPLFGGEDE